MKPKAHPDKRPTVAFFLHVQVLLRSFSKELAPVFVAG